MNSNELIEQGNQLRTNHNPAAALKCYAQVLIEDPDNSSAWNNYGNVLRECGQAQRSIPFLQHAIILDPASTTAQFNLAVALLIQGHYQQGWKQYETRWNYEHLAGTAPQYTQPRWQGEELKDKTILVIGEQGHGDNIQFCRFLYNLHVLGARVKLKITDGLIPLLQHSPIIDQVLNYNSDAGDFDFWIPIMSIPGILGITLENLPQPANYLNADTVLQQDWLQIMGPKKRMRVGFAWSGQRNTWLNQHKSIPFDTIMTMIRSNPTCEWINLQVDATPEESAQLTAAGVTQYPGTIQNFADTAALIMALDVVISVDTAIAHLAGALGRPVWIALNWFGTDWRWLLNRDSSPWYPTARLFRQPAQDDWTSVIQKISQYLSWMKV